MDIVTCCVRSRYVQDLLYVGRVFVYFSVKRTLSVSDIRCVIPMWEDVSQLLIQVCMYGPVLLGGPVILAIITAFEGMNACVVLYHPLQQLYGPYGSNCMATTTVTAVWHACECVTQCALVAHCCYYWWYYALDDGVIVYASISMFLMTLGVGSPVSPYSWRYMYYSI